MNTSQSNLNDFIKLPNITDKEKSNSQSRSSKGVEKHKRNLSNMIKQTRLSGDFTDTNVYLKKSVDNDTSVPAPQFFNKLKEQQQSQEQKQGSLDKYKFKKLSNKTLTSFMQDTQQDSAPSTAANYYFSQTRSNKNTPFTMKDIFLNTTQSQLGRNKTQTIKANQSVVNPQIEEFKTSPMNSIVGFSNQKFNDTFNVDRQKTQQRFQNKPFSNVSQLHKRRKSYDINENPFEGNANLPFTNSPLLSVNQIEKMCFLRSKQAKQDFYLQLMGTNPQRTDPQFLSDIDILKQKINKQKDINTEDQFIQKVKNISLVGQKNIDTPHNSQNSSLKKSSERKDLHLLSQWMEQMLQQLFDKEKKYWNYQDFFDQIEILYTGCIHEVARQVSIECSERGQMITNIWDVYTSIVKQFLTKSQNQYLAKETEQLTIQKNVQTMYQNDIQAHETEKKQLLETLELRNNQITKAKSENRYLSKKWKKMEKAYQLIQDDFSAQMVLYEESLKEITYLKMQTEEFLLQDQIRQAALYEDNNNSPGDSKFMQEVEKIKIELQNQYQFLYQEEKKKLEEAYLIQKESSDKQLLLAQEVEKEHDENQQQTRVQEYTFDDILLANIGVDTSDLLKQTSFGTDTCDLVEREDKCINATQTTTTMENKAQQVNIRSIINDSKVLNMEEQHFLNHLQITKFADYIKEFQEFKVSESYVRDKEDYGKDQIEREFNRIKKDIKSLMKVSYTKEDMTEKDFGTFADFICKVFTSSEVFIFKIIHFLKNLFYEKNTSKIDCVDAQIDTGDNKLSLEEKKYQYNYVLSLYNEQRELNEKLQKEKKKMEQIPTLNRPRNTTLNTPSNNDQLKQKKSQKPNNQKNNNDSFQSSFQNKSQKNAKENDDIKEKEKSKQILKKKQSMAVDKVQKAGKNDNSMTRSPNIKQNQNQDNQQFNFKDTTKKDDNKINFENNIKLEQSKIEQSKVDDETLTINFNSPPYPIESPKDFIPPLNIDASIIEDRIKDQNKQDDSQNKSALSSSSSVKSEDDIDIKQYESNNKIEEIKRLSSMLSKQNSRRSLLILDRQNDPFFNKNAQLNTQERIINMKSILEGNSLDSSQNESMISYKSDEFINDNQNGENSESKILQNQVTGTDKQIKKIVFDEMADLGKEQQSEFLISNSNIKSNQSEDIQISLYQKFQQQTSLVSNTSEREIRFMADEFTNENNQTDQLQTSSKEEKFRKQVTIDKKATQSIFSKQNQNPSQTINKNTQQLSNKTISIASQSESEDNEIEDIEEAQRKQEELLNIDVKPTKPISSLISRFRLFVSDSKNAQISTELLDKVLKEVHTKQKKSKDMLQLNTILKITSQAFIEVFKSAISGNTNSRSLNPFHINLYDSLVNTFGQNSMTISKYNKYIKSCFYYAEENHRLKIISKFISGEYDKMSFQFFIDSIIDLDETGNNGLGIVQNAEDIFWISPKTMADYVENVFGKVLPKDRIAKTQRYLFSLREKLNANNTSKFVLDLDQCLSHIIELYEEIKFGFTKRYAELFSSVDLKNTGLLDFESFQLIFKNVEYDIYKLDNFASIELFNRECDNVTIFGNKKMMSLLRFTQMSIEHNLFTLNTQNNFLDCEVDDEIQRYKSMWPDLRRKIKMRMIKGRIYNSLYKSLIDRTDDYFLKQKINPKYARQILFSIKILEQESKDAVVQLQLNDIICADFLTIQNCYSQVKQKKIANKHIKIQYEKRKDNS